MEQENGPINKPGQLYRSSLAQPQGILVYTHLSESEVSNLIVNEPAFCEVDETIRGKVRIPRIYKGQVRHV